MGRQRGQTGKEERELIIHHFNLGKSLRQIGQIVNRSHTTVQCVIKRYIESHSLKNKVKISGRKIFSDREERWMIRQVKKNPMISAPKLAVLAEQHTKKNVHPETIRRVLRRNNLHGRTARNKPHVNKINRRKRLNFASELECKDFEFWSTVIFADESKFNLFGSDGKVTVWREQNTEMKPANLRPTVKHGGGSVTVWGCMAAGGVGNLVFIDETMDQNVYLGILKGNLNVSAQKLGLRENFKYYQDNDPKHKAWRVRMWLLFNCPKVLETPPQSPDLNVIENLWHYLDRAVRKHNISNKQDLKNVLQEEWDKISTNYCQKLVRSIPNRLREVKLNRGYPTRY